MILLGLLNIVKWLLDLIPGVDFADKPILDVISDVSNIFAWACYLLPVDVLLSVFFMTGLFYGFKFFYHFFVRIKENLFK